MGILASTSALPLIGRKVLVSTRHVLLRKISGFIAIALWGRNGPCPADNDIRGQLLRPIIAGRLDAELGASFGAFRAARCGGRSFVAGGAVIPAAATVLGDDYNPGDHAVISGCSVHGFLAAFRRDGPGRRTGCDYGESIRTACACIWRGRVHSGTAFGRDSLGRICIPVQRDYAGDCAVAAAHRSRMANCL